MSSQSSLRTAVKAMAVFEATKGVAALLGLWGVLSLLHHDIHRLVLELIGHAGLSPQQRYPALLLQAADALNVTPVSTLVLLGCLYAAVRFIEAWGLWQDKAWGSGSAYWPAPCTCRLSCSICCIAAVGRRCWCWPSILHWFWCCWPGSFRSAGRPSSLQWLRNKRTVRPV